MAYLQQVQNLLYQTPISDLSPGPETVVTPALDLRGGNQSPVVRVNAILIQAISVIEGSGFKPSYEIRWAGGATSAQWQVGMSNVFQTFTANELLATVTTSEDLHIFPMVNPYAPFVRFEITAINSTPTDTLLSMWALCQDRDDV